MQVCHTTGCENTLYVCVPKDVENIMLVNLKISKRWDERFLAKSLHCNQHIMPYSEGTKPRDAEIPKESVIGGAP